jgi:hypothetical protein
VHDGFYLRMSLGLGAVKTQVEPDEEEDGVLSYDLSGTAVAIDLLIGGSPVPGLAVGGALLSSNASEPSLEYPGQSDRELDDLTFGHLGLFVDGFPDPKGGFHVGGSIGFDAVTIVDEANEFEEELTFGGAGLNVWAGYDAFISPEWSLGGLLRLTGSVTHNDEDVPRQANSGGIFVMGTALHH